MKTVRIFLVGVVFCTVLVGSSNATHADNGAQIGFIVDKEFSSFLRVNGELVFDLFAPLRDAPGFDGFVNTNSEFLKSIGFFENDFVAAVFLLGVYSEFLLSQGLATNARFRMVMNPDPFVLYEFDIENTTNQPMEILFSISPPIVPVAGANNVISQLNVNLIDKNNDGVVLIDALNANLQSFFVIDDSGILQNAGVDLGGDINTEGVTSFSIPETAGPVSPSATGWEFMDVQAFFTLSPGDQVIMTGMVGVGGPGTFFPALDETNFASLDDIADCFNDGNDDDADGVPNGCDQCPGEDDLVDEDDDGVPDCANDAPPNPDDDDGGDNEPPPVDNDNDDGDGDDGDGEAPVVPPATFCAFGTFNMLPLMLFGLAALRKRRSNSLKRSR